MARVVGVLCATLLFAACPRAAADAHPIAGVISMLQDIEVQSKEEGAAEAALFQKFEYWCSTTSKALEKTIAKEKATIAELDDKSAGLTSDIATLGEEIETLTKELETRNAAAAKAKQVREEELELYNEDVKNLKRTTGAVHTAVEVMEDSEALLQKPAAKTYTNKAGGVIETFKGMEKGFEGDTLDAHQQEANKKKAYALAKQAQDFAIKAAEDSKAEKEGIKGDKEAELADAKSAREQEQSALETDSVSLDDTHKECTAKTEEWNQRSAVRAGEIEAVQVAQKILAKVTGVRNPDEHVIPSKSLIASVTRITQDSSDFQAVTGVLSLLQVDDPRVKAVNLLRQAATKGHSKALQDLAEQLRTYDGPFDKIKGMMQKMIFRLMSEQKDEDDHKNWCDLETEKNTESKSDKKAKMEALDAKIKDMDAAIKLLVEQVSANDEKVKEIEEYVAEETEMRDENHAEILATIKDSQDAQKAVTQATGVLKDFYKSSGEVAKEPWEFLQTGARLPESPDTWDSSYTGTSGGGAQKVLDLLDATMVKFSEMEADAKAADVTDQKNFEEDRAAKKVEMETTKQDSQMKTSKKDSLQGKMEAAAAQLKSTTAEHDAVEQYLKDLEPACGTGDSSYEDRKQARSDEITALRNAQGILEEAFRAKGFLQKSK